MIITKNQAPLRPRGKETDAITEAIGVLDRVASDLGTVDGIVSSRIEQTADALSRPNLARAAVQVRTAINAVAGARRRLERRLAIGAAPRVRSAGTERRG